LAKQAQWIVEDGSCVENANTFSMPQDTRDYFARLPNGEMWDNSSEGCKVTDEQLDKFKAAAIEYLKMLDWVNDCCCCNDLPMPYDCSCSQTGCPTPILTSKRASPMTATS